jgi:endonuclease/exonuclease/phosphatase family metal-dependent hydrolase
VGRRRYFATVLRVLTWNLFHGRDFPPDPALFTWRSRLLRITERNATHVQVNRSLEAEFASVIARADWDVALLQECPPRWAEPLARACGAEAHISLTSRNSFAFLRRIAAALNPDLVGSDEGGSNLTLARRASGRIAARRELVLAPGPQPERRTMAFTRLGCGICIANLHASTGPANRPRAERELLIAAERSIEWAAGSPLILGGDLNVRPRESDVYAELERGVGLCCPTAPGWLDHLLARDLEVVEPAAAWLPERREVISTGGRAIRLERGVRGDVNRAEMRVVR